MTGRLRTEPSDVLEVVAQPRRVAVVGIKPPDSDAPAGGVPAYLASHGFSIVGVSPKLETWRGDPVYRTLAEIPGPVDVVQIFRRSEAVGQHLDDILAMDPRPSVVWMQLGIRNDEVADALVAAGIDVVQDHCMKIEHAKVLAASAAGG